jgi:hypothetical protein
MPEARPKPERMEPRPTKANTAATRRLAYDLPPPILQLLLAPEKVVRFGIKKPVNLHNIRLFKA